MIINTIIQNIRSFLFENQDTAYKSFQTALMPSVDPNTVIGVRTPILRQYAKKIANDPSISEFLEDLPHKYYEENNLHAFLIEQIMDENELVSRLDAFIPFVDNWATCDSMKPKAFKKSPSTALEVSYRYMAFASLSWGSPLHLFHYTENELTKQVLSAK